MKRILGIILLFGLLVTGASAGDNGPAILGIDPEMTIDGPWYQVNWGAGTPTWASENPFTYTSTGWTVVTITDSFMTGDQFELYDNSVSIGTTPVVPVGLSGYSSDPDGALASGIYSSGTFVLPPGSHSIAVEIIQNPYDCGTAYIRVDATQDPIPAPEFPTAFVPAAMLAGLLAVVLVVRMKTE